MRRSFRMSRTLAASSHNTQPWKFAVEPGRIVILPDLSRRCPAVDPDDHHLFASLGCAAENLVLAAQAVGLQTDDKAHWIEAGRCCERLALQATALGLRSAFINQPVEVAALRQQLATSSDSATAGRTWWFGSVEGRRCLAPCVARWGRSLSDLSTNQSYRRSGRHRRSIEPPLRDLGASDHLVTRNRAASSENATG